MSLKAVIFDMDGVIVDTNPYHRLAWRDYYERNGKPLSDNDFLTYVSGKHNRDIVAHLFHPQKLTPADSKRLGDEKETLFREMYAEHIEPVTGLPTLLASLQKAGIKLGVATSAPVENLDFVLNALAIRPYFGVLLHEQLVENPKPHPEIYLKAMAALDVTPAETVVFEDSMTGIRAASASGAKVVGISTSQTPDELRPFVDAVVEDYTNLTVADLQSLFT